jgi:hypothetical protein
MVKSILIITLFLVTISCSKSEYKCTQELLPINIVIEGKFSYLNVSVGGDAVPPFTANVYYSNKSGYQKIKDTVHISGHIERIPVGGNIYVDYSVYCVDGSYRVEKDTLVKR